VAISAPRGRRHRAWETFRAICENFKRRIKYQECELMEKESTMRNNPVCWFEIYVQDMSRAKAFYEGVLGVTLEKLNSPAIDMWAFGMNSGTVGEGGALVHMPGCPSGGNSTLVYFACEDCAVEESRVQKYGGRIQRPKMSIGEYGFITLAIDTEGNMIGLYSQK
jgi:predicted enzyme related to lactoylglutathione lyase